MTAAMGGEASDPLTIGDACCTTLVACDRLADFARASEWCRAVVEFTGRRGFTHCTCGAARSMPAFSPPPASGSARTGSTCGRCAAMTSWAAAPACAVARLAELRVHQGRL